MADKLYLFDGMAFAFRAYFAIRTMLTDSKGRPTNAVYGFTRVLLKLLREHQPSHIAIVFDAPGKTFRDEMFAEYKATRRETPPDLLAQFPRMYEVVKALNLPLLVVPGVEADDVMGTLARQATEAGLDAVLVTGDKDMLQLIDDRVCVLDPSKGDDGLWCREAEVIERFGVGPAHVVDALALIGDAADNVPGVPGIGDKTAKKLMENYGSLEGIYEHLDELKGKQKERLAENRAQAFASRELVKIKTDVPLDTHIDQLLRKAPDPETLISTFTELEFHAMIEELLPGAVAEGEEQLDYKLLLTEPELLAAIEEMRRGGSFSIDTETTSIDPMRASLVGISLSCCHGKGFYLPLAHTQEAMTIFRQPDDLTTAEMLEALPQARALDLLRPLLEDPSVAKIGHNIKYDLIVFQRAGIALRGISMDTMVASYLTDPSRLRHNLDEVSLQYLRRKLIPISDLIGKGSKATTFDHVPVDRASCYACEDADISWRLAEIFQAQLHERGLEQLFQEVELPLLQVLARMERRGIALDTAALELVRGDISQRLGELTELIIESAGEPFKINSPKQLQEILFTKLGLKPLRKTKTGYSTDVDVLEALAREHPLPGLILEYRMLEKLRGTYVEALPKLLHPETGRIHTSFNQAVAATGRLSSSDPNLQNIPVRSEHGRRIREAFIPGYDGYRLISADYSQIELRVLAHLSGDAALHEAFERDTDVHRETAARVFQVAPDLVTADMRRQAKAVNFGVVYGQSAFGLSRSLGISNAEAARFIDAYFAQYPDVRRWLDETLLRAKDEGYVTTLLNRRRYLPELKSGDVNVRRAAERMAINTPVQGSAADIIKVAMIRLDETLEALGGALLLQVHDELLVEAPEDRAEAVAAEMRRVMEGAAQLDVSLKVDVGIGMNWSEAH